MATVYKKITSQNLINRDIPTAQATDKANASTIIGIFINLFKQKHLS